jgi:hypothetical protein
MKKGKDARVEEILSLAQQTMARAGAVQIALVAAITEAGMPVERIVERMDRHLAALEKEHPALATAYAPHVAELKLLLTNPPRE